MKISFDLDDTLIGVPDNGQHEPNRVPIVLRLWFNEPLRLGICSLANHLQESGHQICIYTTSYRPIVYMRLLFWFYGIHLAEIINQDMHARYCEKHNISPQPSKNPKWFDIGLHVDDSEGVGLEADRYTFNTIIISPGDRNWTQKIIDKVASASSSFGETMERIQ
ncbi:hypothetical protein [Roseofilum casamattae]|uniref:Uncharacterized protein n=1 Tax=Roseofilum casamattae BLCC-M143 TaxID=3022442 RepID=A0ABT7C3Q4_9CYAN|nr:hypothetical protein [Roseofilum casamattae]MDJ1185434.1 hypothetical protein [Roseofilum casamattae BLCC-M143]